MRKLAILTHAYQCVIKLLLTLVCRYLDGMVVVGSCYCWLEEYIKMPTAFVNSFEKRARNLFNICRSAFPQSNAV